MVKKIGNQTYPDQVMEIMADRNLGKLFRAFLKSKLASENSDFLDLVAKRFDPKKIYPKFIDPKASGNINVSHANRKRAMDLAEANDFKNSEWKKIMRDLCNEIEYLLQQNFVVTFWKYKPFLEFHNARAVNKMKGDPLKAARLLGVSDPRAVKSLMVAHATGDQKGAKTITDKLAATPELKKKKVKSSMITNLLRKAKVI